ncbi:putative MFS family arabinose efflux permease [Actinocorallia herbida]|uniref:Putative MFS family arabinose efflux permease n=1 Tax=Actinocorallia herbida TaxID=58109 RepID=A0A3N1DC11_9ACTN|nr:MFS transporter [Actinocorallia herbida]ROO91063.1 putative MFS family arabinose efflux permease [Actinocorallia herbida]
MGRHRRPTEPRITYREIFAEPEFRRLWAAQTLSSLGDQLAQVALAVLVYDRTQSPLLTALTYALTYLPPIMGGPVLSGLADHFPRRRVMVVSDLVRMALMGLMAVDGMPFAGLCALVFLTILMASPFSAARAALLPDILEGDKYVLGAAITNITHQACQMLGFVAGGALVAFVGTREALVVNALTFLVSAAVLIGLRHRPAPARTLSRLRLWGGTREGARMVFGDRTLRSLVSFAWLCSFYTVPEGLAAPYGATFGADPLYVGVLMAAMPTGMVAGSFFFSRFVRPTGRIKAMGWMSILACAPLVVCALDPAFPVTVLLWALSGVGSAYQVAANTAFVSAVPPEGRGRAFGLAQSGILAGQGLGILVGGALAQVIGPQTVVALAGMAGLSTAAILALVWTRVRGDVLGVVLGPAAPAAKVTAPSSC